MPDWVGSVACDVRRVDKLVEVHDSTGVVECPLGFQVGGEADGVKLFAFLAELEYGGED